MQWINVNDEMPKKSDTIDGRVIIIDEGGYMVWSLMLGSDKLLAEIPAKYWLKGIPIPPQD